MEVYYHILQAEKRIDKMAPTPDDALISIAHSLIILNERLDDINASIMEVGGDDSHLDKLVRVTRELK